jgi:hypothetical protein
LAAISDHKKENLKRIFRHTDYKAAFDVQLDVLRLARGMRLSTTHTMFTTRCHEVSSISTSNLNILTIPNKKISTISITSGISRPRRSSEEIERQYRR